jgi:hypothetical protein
MCITILQDKIKQTNNQTNQSLVRLMESLTGVASVETSDQKVSIVMHNIPRWEPMAMTEL